MESELTRSEESIINPPVYDGDDEMSIDRDASMAVQMGSNMETSVDEVTPYPTPGPASRTRSHDGQETKLSAPQLSIQLLMEEMDVDMKYSRGQQEEEKKANMEVEDSDFEVIEEDDSGIEYTHITVARHLNDTTI